VNRRQFLASAAGAAMAPPPVHPNILVIMADDMGRDWLSCYGSSHSTPHVDRLAAQGVRFETMYCTPICTPTRVELLTGRYPFRTGWTDHHDVPRWGGKGLDWEREVTFARMLRDAGYATAIAGKWQINDLRNPADVLARHGFDEHCMWTGGEDGNPASEERYENPFLQINGERGVRAGRFGPDVVNRFVLDFIRRNKDRPFLAYYPMILNHSPYVRTPLSRNAGPERKSLYAGMVTYMDSLVGRAVEEIDRLGLANRTLVVFTSDNGSPVGGTLNGVPCPPAKGKVADLGVHTAFIARAPWLWRAGEVTRDLADFTDVLPTLAAAAGVPLPKGVKLDGRSILSGPKREWVYTQRGPHRAVRDQRYLLNSSGAMFDLENDPFERRDLRSSVEHAAARARLAAVLSAMPADGPPPFAGYKPRLPV
jgi:arylsulfatase A-like enzyme